MHTSGPVERLCTLQGRHEVVNVSVPTTYTVYLYYIYRHIQSHYILTFKKSGKVLHAGQAGL